MIVIEVSFDLNSMKFKGKGKYNKLYPQYHGSQVASSNVEKCREMLRNVEKCRVLSRNVEVGSGGGTYTENFGK